MEGGAGVVFPLGLGAWESPWVGAGRWSVGVSRGCLHPTSPKWTSRVYPEVYPGAPAVASPSPAAAGSGNLKFPVPSSLISSSSGTAAGVMGCSGAVGAWSCSGGMLCGHLPVEG